MAATKGIRAGKAYVELYADQSKLARGLKQASAKLKAFGDGVGQIGMGMATLGAAIITPLVAATKIFSGMGDQLHKMSLRTGVSVEALSELGFAAEQSGTDLDTLEKGVRTMQRTVNDAGRGLSTATDALADLGLEVGQLKGLGPERQFKLIADRLSLIADDGKRAAVAMMIFGRAGTQLLPMMQDGAAGMEKLQDQARKLGLTISAEAAKKAADFTDQMNILWKVVKINAFEIGSALAPAIVDLANKLLDVLKSTIEWIRANGELIVKVAKLGAIVTVAGVAMVLMSKIILAIGIAFKAAAIGIYAFKLALTALSKHPYLIIVTLALTLLAIAIKKILSSLEDTKSEEADLARQRALLHEERMRQLEAETAAAKKLDDEAALKELAAKKRLLELEEQLAALEAQTAARTQTAADREMAGIREIADEKRKLIKLLLDEEQARQGGPRAGRISELERRQLRASAEEAFAAQDVLHREETDRAVEKFGRAVERWDRSVDDYIRRTGAQRAEAEMRLRYERHMEREAKKPEGRREKPLDFEEFVQRVTEGVGIREATGVSVRGTFNAAALLGLQAGGPADRTAKAAEEIRKNTKKIAENTKKQAAFK